MLTAITRTLHRMRRRVVDHLLAADRHPDWPLRCESRGCDDAAEPYMLPDGRVRIVCRDCAQYLETLQDAAKRAAR